MLRSFVPEDFIYKFKFWPLFFCLIFIVTFPDAGTYEGTVGIYHVLMDIDIKAQDGKVQGSYFYKKSGISIRLEGKKTGDSILLSEHDEQGNVTGQFLVVKKDKEIKGEWISSDKQNRFAVILKESDPKKMKLIQQNTLLDEKDQEILDSEFPEDPCNSPAITYDYKDNFIRSLTLSNQYTCGEYPKTVSMHKTYNAQTGAKINFWDEIDSSHLEIFKNWLQKETQEKFTELRSDFSDSEWINIFKQYPPSSIDFGIDFDENPKKTLDKIFTVRDASEIMDDFHIGSDGKVHLGRCNYFGFPDDALLMDFCNDVIISPGMLKGFVKKNSILMKLTR